MATLNIVMAGVISLVIFLMASINNIRVKALVYSLPIPITISLLMVGKGIDSTHVIGLFLLCLFLWLVFYFHQKLKINILISNALSIFLYLTIGMIMVKNNNDFFWEYAIIFAFLWGIYVFFYKRDTQISKKKSFKPLSKSIFVFIFALALFSLKDFFKGIVVTFPYLGMFAVIETRQSLYTLAGEFTRNSIAILSFFVSVFILENYVNFYIAILLSLPLYIIALCLVNIGNWEKRVVHFKKLLFFYKYYADS